MELFQKDKIQKYIHQMICEEELEQKRKLKDKRLRIKWENHASLIKKKINRMRDGHQEDGNQLTSFHNVEKSPQVSQNRDVND
mmetsp:Transcript_19008/g.18676  ORF Transcript_19008/g.18676 Transcript_19008/m.18676 type:complete len:83 (-) Transcript_19008:219-467(-)